MEDSYLSQGYFSESECNGANSLTTILQSSDLTFIPRGHSAVPQMFFNKDDLGIKKPMKYYMPLKHKIQNQSKICLQNDTFI